MVTNRLSKTPTTPKLNLAGLPKRVRRGSSVLSYIIERERGSRSPAWRWLFAEQLVISGRKPPPKSVDPIFAKAMRYRSLMQPNIPVSRRAAFERGHPDLAKATEVYEQAGLRRWVLEARLLAGQSVDEIASLEGMAASVVTEYEAVFFNVVGRLDAKFWVIGRAIGPNYHERLEAGEVGVILKTFAHFCGARMLDHMLQTAVDRNGTFIPLDVSDLSTAEAASAAMCRLTIEFVTCPPDPKRFVELMRIRELIGAAKRRFSSKTEEAAPVLSDLELPSRRYDLDFEFPGAISAVDQAVPEPEPPVEHDGPLQTGEVEQDRDVA